MTSTQKKSGATHITLWLVQILLAATMLMGAVFKFMPVSRVAAMMPWMGEVPPGLVRALGIIDLLGALGVILPTLLRVKPVLTPWAAVGIIALMLCAAVFHIARGEASDIGINIFSALLAIYIAWGRFKKYPVAPTNVSIP